MSLLSSTQGTPERVLSVLQVLSAHGGALPRADLFAWLNPSFVRGGAPRTGSTTAVEQTLGAATSLRLVVSADGGFTLAVDLPDLELPALANLTHERLTDAPAGDADAVLLQAFAFVAARCEQAQGLGWLQTSNKVFGDDVNDALKQRADTAAEGKRFNETKVASFWRWMAFVGLATDLPDMAYPYVTERLAIELRRAGLPFDVEIPVRDLLTVIAERMPYLDGGPLYLNAAARLGLPPTGRTLSPLLSIALRDLQDDGVLTLGARSDAAGLVALTADAFNATKAVQFVVLQPEAADA